MQHACAIELVISERVEEKTQRRGLNIKIKHRRGVQLLRVILDHSKAMLELSLASVSASLLCIYKEESLRPDK